MGTPAKAGTKVTNHEADTEISARFDFKSVLGKGYINYPSAGAEADSDRGIITGPSGETSSHDASDFAADDHKGHVRGRSQPVQLTEFTYPSGKQGFLVVGTIRPHEKQRRQKFGNREDAETTREVWESERLRAASRNRLQQTALTIGQLRECEAAYAIAEKEGFSLLDAVIYQAKNPKPAEKPVITFRKMYDQFLEDYRNRTSVSQYDSVRQRGAKFGAFVLQDTGNYRRAGKVFSKH